MRKTTGSIAVTSVWQPGVKMALHRLRQTPEGSFSTVPFVLRGGKLELNTWSSYGGLIQVELVEVPDERSRTYVPPVDGRGFDDTDVITGDNLHQTVTWNGESDISAWEGKNVRLRFKLHRSRIYAMQIR